MDKAVINGALTPVDAARVLALIRKSCAMNRDRIARNPHFTARRKRIEREAYDAQIAALSMGITRLEQPQ